MYWFKILDKMIYKYYKYLVRVIPAIGALALSIFVAKELNSEQAGMIFLALAASQLIAMVSIFGGNVYFLRRYATFKSFKRVEKNIFKCSKIIVFIFSLIFVLVLYYFVGGNEEIQFFLMLLSAPFMAMMILNGSVLRAFDFIVLSGFFEYGIVASGSICLLTIASFWTNIGATELSVFYLISAIASFFISEFAVSRISSSELNEDVNNLPGKICALKDVFKLFPKAVYFNNSWRIGVMSVIVYMTQWMPLFILKEFSLEVVALISLAYRYASIIGFLGVTVDLAFAPIFARLANQEKFFELDEIIKKIIKTLIPVAILFFSMLCLFIVVLNNFFFIDKYDGLIEVSLIVFLSAAILFILSPFTNLIVMIGREDVCNKAAIFCFLFVIFGVVLGMAFFESALLMSIYIVTLYAIGKITSSVYISYIAVKHISNQGFVRV